MFGGYVLVLEGQLETMTIYNSNAPEPNIPEGWYLSNHYRNL